MLGNFIPHCEAIDKGNSGMTLQNNVRVFTLLFSLEMAKLFFDCLNISNFDPGKHSKISFKSPYQSRTCFHLKVWLCSYHSVDYCVYMHESVAEGSSPVSA